MFACTKWLAPAIDATTQAHGPQPWRCRTRTKATYITTWLKWSQTPSMSSPLGELIDGVCDHFSQVVIYVAFVLVLQRHGWGPWAWVVASIAGASHFVQANIYE